MKELTVALIASSKLIGAGMATVGIVGAGVGIGVLFGFFITSLGRNPFLEDKLLKYLIQSFNILFSSYFYFLDLLLSCCTSWEIKAQHSTYNQCLQSSTWIAVVWWNNRKVEKVDLFRKSLSIGRLRENTAKNFRLKIVLKCQELSHSKLFWNSLVRGQLVFGITRD